MPPRWAHTLRAKETLIKQLTESNHAAPSEGTPCQVLFIMQPCQFNLS